MSDPGAEVSSNFRELSPLIGIAVARTRTNTRPNLAIEDNLPGKSRDPIKRERERQRETKRV